MPLALVFFCFLLLLDLLEPLFDRLAGGAELASLGAELVAVAANTPELPGEEGRGEFNKQGRGGE